MQAYGEKDRIISAVFRTVGSNCSDPSKRHGSKGIADAALYTGRRGFPPAGPPRRPYRFWYRLWLRCRIGYTPVYASSFPAQTHINPCSLFAGHPSPFGTYRHLRIRVFPQAGHVRLSSRSREPQLGQNFGLSSHGAQSTHCSTSALYITSLT